jgi:hypothetical protein
VAATGAPRVHRSRTSPRPPRGSCRQANAAGPQGRAYQRLFNHAFMEVCTRPHARKLWAQRFQCKAPESRQTPRVDSRCALKHNCYRLSLGRGDRTSKKNLGSPCPFRLRDLSGLGRRRREPAEPSPHLPREPRTGPVHTLRHSATGTHRAWHRDVHHETISAGPRLGVNSRPEGSCPLLHRDSHAAFDESSLVVRGP